MIHDWFRATKFDCMWEQFQTLPRHPAYRYEYRGGQATIAPQPRFHHALLSFAECRFLDRSLRPLSDHPSTEPVHIRLAGYLRRFHAEDWPALPDLMARCFSRRAPLGHLQEQERISAAQQLLERTRNEQDGPLVEGASFVISDPKSGRPLGAILITLTPEGDLGVFNSAAWSESPPPHAVQRRWGRPHVTWVFVDPQYRRRGYAETLLSAAIRELDSCHYPRLASTFLWGDTDSMAWHWRMGFRLLSHPGSPRRIKPWQAG